ncbi:MAG: hypothetical protein EAZ74_04460 [Alphaproteobacteria bacterium]|nr:MAG: hypothetical protein EAY76_00765 [Alphaproteobacteria bacterium]TAF14207.1 MAG: hypothetical protein EAZ74_04460 [Alphaproteobacteria bacterium]TAF39329.1 MAG: hypothetical protein EAZ66_04935 [Alphaproteobacteria bacterium]TAF76916.1 MAG: hypothetical protein EAZ52_02005 [Alphaproteobacteria bacterium]
MTVITTPTLQQLLFAQQMLKVSSITTVSTVVQPEVAKLLEEIAQASGATLHVDSAISSVSDVAPKVQASLPHKATDTSRSKG